ncbi:aminotransferase class I/II-fold pyridoxal phosphate-dependent enzyme [Candidatus Aerophobetes bacterium]|nr:aminotransferase class I/II-fold pyridoxal phosphate-dependent enzyme [Candidatus Aerophobetes bacterium]
MIDLRSDTVTKPTAGMLDAMFKAEVGDDVFGEDPTTNWLQEKVAELLGKEDSLFVASGTMANQLSLRAQTQPGDEIILERSSHIFNSESGGGAAISGVQFYLLEGDRGILDPSRIEEVIRDSSDHHRPVTRLIWIENTHNRGGGSVYPLEVVKEIFRVARKNSLLVHMDGARLLNATIALGIDPKKYTQYVDSTILCLSKGLGAPVGTMVVGSREFIKRVHRFRKMFGGGMRQIGYLAAAGIYALDHNVERLAEDHVNAKRLAEALSEFKSFKIDPKNVQTNIIHFDIIEGGMDSKVVVNKLKDKGVLVLPRDDRSIRAVTHLGVDKDDIEEAISIMKELFS